MKRDSSNQIQQANFKINKEEKSLYDTVYNEYKDKKPISRIVYLAKITQPQAPPTTQKKKEKEPPKPDLIQNFIADLKGKLETFTSQSNVMIIFIGDIYAFVGIENSSENIMELIKFLKKGSTMTESAHVILFNEECPFSTFPVWYKYEGEVYEKESQIYKDMTPAEKGWALYDNFFCGLGKNLKKLIKNEEDFTANESAVIDEEVKYVKYLPSMNEIEVFISEEYANLDNFIQLYLDELEIDFDDDVVYPYYWPINV